jgi:DHA1 family bicyclomycin/chloramphenicol resistance-like MFS transporter
MNKTPADSQRLILAILVFTSGTSILSTDLYAPSLAHLPEYFATSVEMVKLTMIANVVVYGLSQLVFGPLSDRFGRRPVILGGMIAFTLANLACALAQSIEQLIAARVIQGIAGAAESVVVLAIIRDLFSGPARIKALAAFGIALGVAPAVGPLLGGYIHTAFGWRANFYLLTALSAVALVLLVRKLPESASPDLHAVRLAQIARSYYRLLTNSVFMSYALMMGASLGSIFAFITAGPFIYINHFGVPTEQFGIYYLGMVSGFILGSFFSGKVAHRLRPETTLWIGIIMMAAGVTILAWFILGQTDSPLRISAAMFFVLFGCGPIFSVAPSLAMDLTIDRAGYASALLGCTELLVAGVAAGLVTILYDGTSVPLGITMAGLVIVSVVSLYTIHLRKARNPVE